MTIVANHRCHGHNRVLLREKVLTVGDCADLVAKSPLCNGVSFDIGVNGASLEECSCCAKVWLYQDVFEYKEGYNLYSPNAICSLTCPEDMVFTWRDCDGDGLADPQCWDPEGLSTFVRLSSDECNEITIHGSNQGPACPNITKIISDVENSLSSEFQITGISVHELMNETSWMIKALAAAYERWPYSLVLGANVKWAFYPNINELSSNVFREYNQSSCGAYPELTEHGTSCKVSINHNDSSCEYNLNQCVQAALTYCQNWAECVAITIVDSTVTAHTQLIGTDFVCPEHPWTMAFNMTNVTVSKVDASRNYAGTVYGKSVSSGRCLLRDISGTIVIVGKVILEEHESLVSFREFAKALENDSEGLVDTVLTSLKSNAPVGTIVGNIAVPTIEIIETVYNCSGPPVEGSIRKNMWMCLNGTFSDPCNNDCFCRSSGEIASGDVCGLNCMIDDNNKNDFQCYSSWENLGNGECVQGGDSNNLSISFYWGWVDDCIIEANRRPDVVAYSTTADDAMWFQRDYQCLLYTNETSMSGDRTCDWPKYSKITPVGSCEWSESQEDLDCSVEACTYQASEVLDGFNCYLRTDVYQAQLTTSGNDDRWIFFFVLATIGGCLLISCYVVILRRRIRGLEEDFNNYIVSLSLPPGLIPEKMDGMDKLPEIDWKKLEVVKDVGKGSFGKVFCVVYRCPATIEKKDIEPGSYVYAVKIMHNVFNEEQRESFKNEIRILQHDLPVNANVVPIIGITKEGGTNNIGIIMPYYELGSLHDHLYDKKKADRLTFKTIDKLWLILDVATGLNHLHTHGIIHRDIAARNILLFKDMNRVNASITDFGMAIFSLDMNEDGRLQANCENKNFLGPLKWMAKECLQKNEFTFKSDVYSFAITCWEIMSEKVPWEKMSAKEAARYALDGGRPPRLEGLEYRTGRPSTSLIALQGRDIRKATNLKPPGVGRPRHQSVSSVSLSHSLSHMESFDCPSYCERTDYQLQAEIWNIMNQCWRPEPEDRPAIDDVQEAIRNIFSTIGAEGEDYDTFADKAKEVEPEYVGYFNEITMTTLGEPNSPYEKNKCDGNRRTGIAQTKGLRLDAYSGVSRNSGSHSSYAQY